MDNTHFSAIERRIRLEYTGWPQLALTLRQASRLWDLPYEICHAVMTTLVADGFLEHEGDRFCRRGLGRYLYTVMAHPATNLEASGHSL